MHSIKPQASVLEDAIVKRLQSRLKWFTYCFTWWGLMNRFNEGINPIAVITALKPQHSVLQWEASPTVIKLYGIIELCRLIFVTKSRFIEHAPQGHPSSEGQPNYFAITFETTPSFEHPSGKRCSERRWTRSRRWGTCCSKSPPHPLFF